MASVTAASAAQTHAVVLLQLSVRLEVLSRLEHDADLPACTWQLHVPSTVKKGLSAQAPLTRHPLDDQLYASAGIC